LRLTDLRPVGLRLVGLRLADADLSVRWLSDLSERLAVVRGVLLPGAQQREQGVMLTAYWRKGIGYAATADLSAQGLNLAAQRALDWAKISDRSGLFKEIELPKPTARQLNFGPTSRSRPMSMSRPTSTSIDAHEQAPLSDRQRASVIDVLRRESDAMNGDSRIVNRLASAQLTEREELLYWNGELVARQQFSFLESSLEVTAQHQGVTQTRSSGGQYNGICRQGESIESLASTLAGQGARIAAEALQLVAADNCPSQTMDLLLAPDQMMLQIHESIGHPLELDRILGDERNFAGTSFVTLDMFGHYQYGSPLLNVSFDPSVPGELASYAVDDDGTLAERQLLIEAGVLKRPLGAPLSTRRAHALGFALDSVANSRACAWYRPTIDRMANINVEAGEQSERQLIAQIEHGVLMRTNASWSIDDSRNKFQFGCEWAQMIRNGELAEVVRNPNYRGVSANFWRSLAAVGAPSTLQIHGTPYCGKGEPGQVIRVGHRSPMCLFRDVEVFGA
jgi:predicted Zn-dependent protease